MSYKVCIALAVVVVVIVSLVCCCCYWFAGKKEGFSALADQNLFVKLKIRNNYYQKYYVKNTPAGPPVMVTLVESGFINVPDLLKPLTRKKCLTYGIQFKDGNKNKDGIYVDRGFIKIENNKLSMDINSNNKTVFGFYPFDNHPHDKSKSRTYIIFAIQSKNPIKLGDSIPVLEIIQGQISTSMFSWTLKIINPLKTHPIKTEQLFGIEKGR